MSKLTIKKISVADAVKYSATLYALVGLVYGFVLAVIFSFASSDPNLQGGPLDIRALGGIIFVVAPLAVMVFGAIGGAIGAAIMTFVCNLLLSHFGGFRMEVDFTPDTAGASAPPTKPPSSAYQNVTPQ